MRFVRLWLWVVVVMTTITSQALALLFDDFSDGDAQGWVQHYSELSDGTPPVFDATSGRYQISSTGPVTNPYEGVAVGYLESKNNEAYRDGTGRFSVILDNDSTSFLVSLRSNIVISPETPPRAAYGFAGNNAGDILYLVRLGGTSECDPSLGSSIAASCYFGSYSLGPGGLQSGVEYRVQATAIGDALSMKFWAASDIEPISPQLTALTSDHPAVLSGTGVVLSLYNSQANTLLSGSFDDVQFIPEPTTALLLTLGLAGLGMRRRGRQRLCI